MSSPLQPAVLSAAICDASHSLVFAQTAAGVIGVGRDGVGAAGGFTGAGAPGSFGE
jgi:hypothetical protein